jgi:acyl carrier protein
MPIVETSQILNLIYSAARDHNEVAEGESQLDMSPDSVFFGTGGQLDSLMLISLVVGIEDRIQEEFEVSLDLANEKAMTQTPQAFRTFGSLAAHISDLLKEISNG